MPRVLDVSTFVAVHVLSCVALSACERAPRLHPTEPPPPLETGDEGARAQELRFVVTGSVDPRELGRVHAERVRSGEFGLELDATSPILRARSPSSVVELAGSGVHIHPVVEQGPFAGIWWIEGTLVPSDHLRLGASAEKVAPLDTGVVKAGLVVEASADDEVLEWAGCFEHCLEQHHLLHGSLGGQSMSEHEECLHRCARERSPRAVDSGDDGWFPVEVLARLAEGDDACRVASGTGVVEAMSREARENCFEGVRDCSGAGQITCIRHAEADMGSAVVEVFVDTTATWYGKGRGRWDGHTRFSFLEIASGGASFLTDVVDRTDPYNCEYDQSQSVDVDMWKREEPSSGESEWFSIATTNECEESLLEGRPFGYDAEETVIIHCAVDTGALEPRCRKTAASESGVQYITCGQRTVQAVDAKLDYYRHATPFPVLEVRRVRHTAACEPGSS